MNEEPAQGPALDSPTEPNQDQPGVSQPNMESAPTDQPPITAEPLPVNEEIPDEESPTPLSPVVEPVAPAPAPISDGEAPAAEVAPEQAAVDGEDDKSEAPAPKQGTVFDVTSSPAGHGKKALWVLIAGVVLVAACALFLFLSTNDDDKNNKASTNTNSTDNAAKEDAAANNMAADETTATDETKQAAVNSDDNIKKVVDYLLADLSAWQANNKGQAVSSQADIDKLVAASEANKEYMVGDQKASIFYKDDYKLGDLPAAATDFWVVPAYKCDGNDKAVSGSERDRAVISRLNGDRLYCKNT